MGTADEGPRHEGLDALRSQWESQVEEGEQRKVDDEEGWLPPLAHAEAASMSRPRRPRRRGWVSIGNPPEVRVRVRHSASPFLLREPLRWHSPLSRFARSKELQTVNARFTAVRAAAAAHSAGCRQA